MSSASSAAYFSELSLFTEGSNCNNRINVGWKAPVYDQVTAERSGGQYSETSWPIQAYQFDLCSYQTPPSLQQNSYGFYRDKIIPGRNKLAGEDLRFKGINSATYSNGLRSEPEEIVEKEIPDHQGQKKSQISETLDWLSENYEKADGVCLPRCVLYSHYLDFCKKNTFTPAGAATFGKKVMATYCGKKSATSVMYRKIHDRLGVYDAWHIMIIRQKFPKLTTRRLGTRGQSKYHYYGIGIKETSIYYQSVYSGKGLTRFSGVKIKTEGSSRKYSLSSKTGTLLPDFPNVENLCLPENVDIYKLRTFTMMYRTHCQRILDTVISGNFEEVQNFLLHFWQGMPSHLDEILQCDVTNDIIALCDSILYKAIIDVLIPTTIQELPETLSQEVKLFIKSLPVWLENSLENMSQKLQDIKQKVVQAFVQSIRRQLSFVRLAQIARSVLQNSDNVQKMIRDALRIDFLEISYQTVYMTSLQSSHQQKVITTYFEEFLSLLQHQSSVESFTEWMDNILDRCIMQPSDKNGRSFDKCSADFLLHWAAIVSLITKDLTLQNCVSFGSFHLIRMMLDEYIFLVIETQYDMSRESFLQNNIKKLMKNTEEISMSTQTRTPSSRHQLTNKPRRSKNELFEEKPDVCQSVQVHQHEENKFRHVGSILNSRDVSISCLPNFGLRTNSPFYYTTDSKNDTIRVDDTRPIQLTPLRYHNHQHHHHHHHHHHHGYSAFNSTGYDITKSYLPQYGKSSFAGYVAGNLQQKNGAIKSVDRFVDNTSRASRATDALNPKVDSEHRALTKNAQYDIRANSYTGYSCYSNRPPFDACNVGRAYGNGSYQGTLLQDTFDPALKYYSRCLDAHKVSNPCQPNSYTASFMEIVQPDSERDYNGRQDIQQDQFFKTDAHYSLTAW